MRLKICLFYGLSVPTVPEAFALFNFTLCSSFFFFFLFSHSLSSFFSFFEPVPEMDVHPSLGYKISAKKKKKI